MKRRYLILLFIIISCTQCYNGKYAASNKKYKQLAKKLAKEIRFIPQDVLSSDSVLLADKFIGTTNFGLRKPNFVIIHHTAQKSCEKTLFTFTQERTQVSAHYLICKDGTIHHLLNNYLRAWHSGLSKWGNVTDVNSSSIGIELDNNGTEEFSDSQIKSLLALLNSLRKNYAIPATNFLGHADIAPGRKVDPSNFFPWKELSEKGFGIWYGDTSQIILPSSFNLPYALKIIGYNISDISAAIQAFRLHYLQSGNTGELNDSELKVLYALMLKFL